MAAALLHVQGDLCAPLLHEARTSPAAYHRILTLAGASIAALGLLSLMAALPPHSIPFVGALQEECVRQVWVIRHGEKSEHPEPGSSDVLGLNATGMLRAQHLRQLVVDGKWPRFSHVYATSPYEAPFVRREWQTVEPLASELGVPVDTTFTKEQTDRVAIGALRAVREGACGQRVLISWEHCRIPSLLMALGCTSNACVRCWPDGVYDSFFVLDVGSETLQVHEQQEGFARDVPGYAEYECAGPLRRPYSHCRYANGTWIGPIVEL